MVNTSLIPRPDTSLIPRSEAAFIGYMLYRNLPKISPPSEIRPPPFLNEVVAFLLKVHPPIYATVHAVMLASKKQHEGRPLLLLRKQAHDKTGIAESLHVKITKARLTACEVFSREMSQLSKIRPPPSFRRHLTSSPMGVFLRDYGICFPMNKRCMRPRN